MSGKEHSSPSRRKGHTDPHSATEPGLEGNCDSEYSMTTDPTELIPLNWDWWRVLWRKTPCLWNKWEILLNFLILQDTSNRVLAEHNTSTCIFLLTLQKTQTPSFKDWKLPEAGCTRRHLSWVRVEAQAWHLGSEQRLRAARADESGNGEGRAVVQPLSIYLDFFQEPPLVLTPNFFKLSQSCLCTNTRLIC